MRSDFSCLLGSFSKEALESYPGAIYGLWPDLTIAWTNRAYFRFAAENSGEPQISSRWAVGANVIHGIRGEQSAFYRKAFKACIESDQKWEHTYENSSAERYRFCRMLVSPLGNGEGLLVVNSTIRDSLHNPKIRPSFTASAAYKDRRGFVHQCCECRRVQNHEHADRWDWVPEWVSCAPLHTTHTLCDVCCSFYVMDAGHGLWKLKMGVSAAA